MQPPVLRHISDRAGRLPVGRRQECNIHNGIAPQQRQFRFKQLGEHSAGLGCPVTWTEQVRRAECEGLVGVIFSVRWWCVGGAGCTPCTFGVCFYLPIASHPSLPRLGRHNITRLVEHAPCRPFMWVRQLGGLDHHFEITCYSAHAVASQHVREDDTAAFRSCLRRTAPARLPQSHASLPTYTTLAPTFHLQTLTHVAYAPLEHNDIPLAVWAGHSFGGRTAVACDMTPTHRRPGND